MKEWIIGISILLIIIAAMCAGDCTIEPMIGAIGVIRCKKLN